MSNKDARSTESEQQRGGFARSVASPRQKQSGLLCFCNELSAVQLSRARVYKDGARPVVFCVEPCGNEELNEIEPIQEEED